MCMWRQKKRRREGCEAETLGSTPPTSEWRPVCHRPTNVSSCKKSRQHVLLRRNTTRLFGRNCTHASNGDTHAATTCVPQPSALRVARQHTGGSDVSVTPKPQFSKNLSVPVVDTLAVDKVKAIQRVAACHGSWACHRNCDWRWSCIDH